MPQNASEMLEGLSAEFFSRDGIFNLEAFRLFKPTSPLTNLQVAGNFIVTATTKNTLIRFSSTPPIKVTEIEICRSPDDRVYNLFLDPLGWHTVISMQSGTNFYTNRAMKKVRQLTKAKDLLFDSVAWSPHNTNEMSTQEILIGTNDGLIFETVLLSDERRFISNTTEQYWRQVMNLGHSVTGLEVIRHPPGSTAILVGEPQRCVILATTPSRMYQFAGWINSSGSNTLLPHLGPGSPPQSKSSSVASNLGLSTSETAATPSAGLFPVHIPALYHSVFNPDDKMPAGSKVTEFPHSFGYSDLKLYRSVKDELPSLFAWMTGTGVFLGNLNTRILSLPPYMRSVALSTTPRDAIIQSCHQPLGTVGDSNNEVSGTHQRDDVFSGRALNLTCKTKLIPYPVIRLLEHTSAPLGICLTAFHIVIAYSDRVKAVNILDDQTVYSMPVGSELGGGLSMGVCRDNVTGIIWLFGNQGLARLNVTNELSRVWRICLDQLQFEEARKFCQTEEQLDTVNMHEAEHYFAKGDFINSARLFARTSVPFEEVALRFSQLSVDHHNSLPESPPVLRGLAVTHDHDIMDAIVPGLEANAEVHRDTVNLRRSAVERTIASSAPLKVLLSTKLEQLFQHGTTPDLKSSDNRKPDLISSFPSSGKVTLLALWLSELLLTEIGFLRDRIDKLNLEDDKILLDSVRVEFKQLMTRPEILAVLPEAKDLLYELVDANGDNEELQFLAEVLGDDNRLVDHCMRLGHYSDALKVLSNGTTCLTRMYDCATTFAFECPEKVVQTWLRLGKRLDPVRLLPAIMLLPCEAAMRYLKCVIERYGCNDQAIHHLFISLCAEVSTKTEQSTNKDDPLMEYLKFSSSKAANVEGLVHHSPLHLTDLTLHNDLLLMDRSLSEPVAEAPTSLADATFVSTVTTADLGCDASGIQLDLPYDPGFVLRTCKEANHLPGTVFVLQLLGMHKQALQAAIDRNDIRLAKEIAQKEFLNQETRRQLWMILARHIIGNQSNIHEATNLLRECPLLKLEDILPYFPDFVTIDQFKDTICASLDSYHQRIEEVKRDMCLTMQSTDALRHQLNSLRSRYEKLDVESKCERCRHLLVSSPFYVFPCGHNFHAACLVELDKLDRIIASDCISCGRYAISDVSTLFFPTRASYETELAIWQ